MGHVNEKLYQERLEKLGNRQQQIADYKEAWTNQIAHSANKRQVEAIVQGAAY